MDFFRTMLGNLRVTANERNPVVVIQADGRVFDVQKNDSKGPLEFPSSSARPLTSATSRRGNLAADGKTSIDGIGASILKIEQ